ncbi:MAG: hypothetical protein GEU26_19110 [Nitrososphaeraceae archaeon]|nr:hypothetical protein [Nitrososphaeraceae archaeon]
MTYLAKEFQNDLTERAEKRHKAVMLGANEDSEDTFSRKISEDKSVIICGFFDLPAIYSFLELVRAVM